MVSSLLAFGWQFVSFHPKLHCVRSHGTTLSWRLQVSCACDHIGLDSLKKTKRRAGTNRAPHRTPAPPAQANCPPARRDGCADASLRGGRAARQRQPPLRRRDGGRLPLRVPRRRPPRRSTHLARRGVSPARLHLFYLPTLYPYLNFCPPAEPSLPAVLMLCLLPVRALRIGSRWMSTDGSRPSPRTPQSEPPPHLSPSRWCLPSHYPTIHSIPLLNQLLSSCCVVHRSSR